MRFHKQLFRHKPQEGIFGDCYRTAVACILDLPPEVVPHKHCIMTGDDQAKLVGDFLAERGILSIAIPFEREELSRALEVAKFLTKGLPYLLWGTSANGFSHVVVGQDDRIIHDPAQDDSGIVGPTADGHFWIELLVRPC